MSILNGKRRKLQPMESPHPPRLEEELLAGARPDAQVAFVLQLAGEAIALATGATRDHAEPHLRTAQRWATHGDLSSQAVYDAHHEVLGYDNRIEQDDSQKYLVAMWAMFFTAWHAIGQDVDRGLITEAKYVPSDMAEGVENVVSEICRLAVACGATTDSVAQESAARLAATYPQGSTRPLA